MKLRSIVILFVLLLLLGGGYWYIQHRETRRGVEQQEAQRVFEFAPGDFRALSIQQEDQRPVVGVRENGGWRIEQPHPMRANDVVWNRAADALANLMRLRLFQGAEDNLPAYELDEPHLTVTATAANGESVEIVFGAEDPVQKNRYAMRPGGPVFLIDGRAYFELDRSLDWLRDKRLFSQPDEPVTRVEYVRVRPLKDGEVAMGTPLYPEEKGGVESVSVVVAREPEQPWRLVSPVEAMANQEAVNAFVDALAYAQGANHVDEPKDLAEYGLAPARARISFQYGAGAELETLFLGNVSGGSGIYAKRADAPAVFTVDGTALAAFPVDPTVFRDRRLVASDPATVRAITYRREGEEAAVQKNDGGAWRIVTPYDDPADPAVINDLLSKLTSYQGHSFPEVSADDAGLKEPLVAVTLEFEDGAAPTTVSIGGDAGDSLRYARQFTGAVVTLTNDEVQTLLYTPFDFWDKELLAFTAEEARRVELEFEGTQYSFVFGSRRWRVEAPGGLGFESQSDMTALLAAVNPLKASSLEAQEIPADLNQYLLDRPPMRMRVVLGEGADARALPEFTVGGVAIDNSRERYALVEGMPQVYRIRQDVVDRVRQVLENLRAQ